MNTSVLTRILKPLEIVIGVLCAVWAVWCLFITVLFLDSTGPFFSNYMNLEGLWGDVIRFLMKVFGYLSYVLNPLLLLWFILMRKQLRKGVATIAIIALSMEILLAIINVIVNHFYPLLGQEDITNSRTVFMTVFSIIDWIFLLMLGIAFLLMNRQFDKKIGAWATTVGILYCVIVLIHLISVINSFVLIQVYPIAQYTKVSRLLNMVMEFVISMRFFSMMMFFISAPHKKR